MHTVSLEMVHVSVFVATTRFCSLGAGSQINKFEQVSSDHHQMSLVGKEEVYRSDVQEG